MCVIAGHHAHVVLHTDRDEIWIDSHPWIPRLNVSHDGRARTHAGLPIVRVFIWSPSIAAKSLSHRTLVFVDAESPVFSTAGSLFSSAWLFSGRSALNVPIGICLHAYAIRSLDQWCSDLTSRNMALTLWVFVESTLFGNTKNGWLMFSLPQKR